jgi:hypothetical protein
MKLTRTTSKDMPRSAGFAGVNGVPPISEKEWLEQVKQLARLYNWDFFHTYDSRRSKPGYPDLHLWKPGRMLWIETKAEKGKLTADQEKVIAGLRAAGAEVLVARPSDWEVVKNVLARESAS